MNDTAVPDSAGVNRPLPTIIAIVLISLFVLRIFTPAHEYPMRTEQVVTMGFDALMLVGLFFTRARTTAPLFWLGMAAGVGSFALRFTSDAAWWTGHLMYSLK
jgi:hypothetical protein